MQLALGTANWLLGKVLNKLSSKLVEAWVASSELSSNMEAIKRKLWYTHGMLHEAQKRDVRDNQGLLVLLHQLSNTADKAEDMLDELGYFLIQDKLYNTQEAAAEVHGVIVGPALHARHVSRHFIGKWFSCCSCSHEPEHTHGDDPSGDDDVDIIKSPPRPVFNRVNMSNRIKMLVEQMQDLCDPVLALLNLNISSLAHDSTVALRRPVTTSMCTEVKLFGRRTLLNKITNDMTAGEYHLERLSVLPVVGPPGIGKTTLIQTLCNDPRIQEHFSIIIWISVSLNFSVHRLSQEIFRCIPPTESDGRSRAQEPTNLDQLQKLIEKRLKSKRFLVVLDDMWTCKSELDWRTLLAPLTKAELDGNMIIVTTRFQSIAELVKTTNPVTLAGLEPKEFWKFFLACIFDDYRTKQDEGLLQIGRKIVEKLKCSPLAARTVGRLLKKDLTQQHWIRVLQRKEWEYQKGDDDIMPGLRISYYYLPFHLKKCFEFCALFPEDYEFDGLELINMWMVLGMIDSNGTNTSIEQVGLEYLNTLVDSGIFSKVNKEAYSYYSVHDLFHELATCISSHECIRIDCSNVRCEGIQSAVRHISFVAQDSNTYSEGSEFYENIRKEIGKLKQTVDVGNLRTVLFIGKFNAIFDKIFEDISQELRALRVLSLVTLPSNFLLHRLSKLIHLRYLKIQVPFGSVISLPNTVTRCYHLEFLDLKGWGPDSSLPRDMSHLINLRHLLANKDLHCKIAEVGKLKFLQELRKFEVRKDVTGFELHELSELTELTGSLSICNLENVKTKGDADTAKLILKGNLDKLKLVWNSQWPNRDPTVEDVLESLRPHPNLRELCIKDHGGSTCPYWLRTQRSIKMLKSLHLHGISWKTLPPFGQMSDLMELKMENISSMHQFGGTEFGQVTDGSFQKLMVLKLADMPQLEKWVGAGARHLFHQLKKLAISNCPKLSELPFSHCISSSTEDSNMTWFPNLRELVIEACPQLSLPPLPHTSTIDLVRVKTTNGYFSYNRNELVIDAYNGALAFHNMHKLEELYVCKTSLSLTGLQNLTSLRKLDIKCCGSVLCDSYLGGAISAPVKSLMIYDCSITGKELSKLLNCLTDLSYLEISDCPNITRLCNTNDMDKEDGNEEGLLFFPPHLSISLHKLEICNCRKLFLDPKGGGLRHLTSLESLQMQGCDSLLSWWFVEEATFQCPFPIFLKDLVLRNVQSLKTMAMLSNLRCLTHLEIVDCDNLNVDGFDPLITQCLTKLVVVNRHDEYSKVTAELISGVARTKLNGSFKLEDLRIDNISELLVYPICDHLSINLHTLCFQYDNRMQRFTEEQEQALQLLTNIQNLYFKSCRSLQSLPAGLYRLYSLKVLLIDTCPGIRSLPKEGLPASLEQLEVYNCNKELKEHCRKLKVHKLKLY